MSLTECNSGTNQKFTCLVNKTTELRTIKTTSNNNKKKIQLMLVLPKKLRGFLQKMVKSKNPKIDIVTQSPKIGDPSVFKINHFKASQILKYGHLRIKLLYNIKLSQTDLQQKFKIVIP